MASYEAEITAVKSFIVQALGQLAEASKLNLGRVLHTIYLQSFVLFIQSYSTLS
jgi:hypothetical protein